MTTEKQNIVVWPSTPVAKKILSVASCGSILLTFTLFETLTKLSYRPIKKQKVVVKVVKVITIF
jgi:hypothetical protein